MVYLPAPRWSYGLTQESLVKVKELCGGSSCEETRQHHRKLRGGILEGAHDTVTTKLIQALCWLCNILFLYYFV
jgi:hypothetical protein